MHPNSTYVGHEAVPMRYSGAKVLKYILVGYMDS